MTIEISGGDHDFDSLSQLEWLETNGIGGWASSTVSGANSRRYHGLLVAATRPPVERTVLLSKLEETVNTSEGTYELGSNRYPGAVHPQGYVHLSAFRRDVFPEFELTLGEARLSKTVAAIDGENTTLVVYQLDNAAAPVRLRLRPLLTSRHYHALGPSAPASPRVELVDGRLYCQLHGDGPGIFLSAAGASFEPGADWYRRFQLVAEAERGFDHEEDLWTPGELVVELQPGLPLGVLITTDPEQRGDPLDLLAKERSRRLGLVAALPVREEPWRTLTLAADQFIISRHDGRRSIIAGYHWFGDWGRDTMIALPGLCLATGRFDDARQILLAYASFLSEGMIPNRFPDGTAEPEYNTVDASLWYLVAIHKYLEATGDKEAATALLPAAREVVGWHDRGTRFGIRVDHDGLLTAGAPGVQLTWMDAKVGDWVVTPRRGKAVEINALWTNALYILADLEARVGDEEAAVDLRARAARVKRRFVATFWNEGRGGLDDVAGEPGADDAVRPNQILALSLPFPLLSKVRARSVLRLVENELLTPFGLRSLSPAHPDYRPLYKGGPVERDGAYHQGTVWGWLLGPYLSGLVRYGGDAGRRRAAALLQGACSQLSTAGVGTCSEIFDGEEPHLPRGCVAQAWSVAELLRVANEDLDWRLE